MKSVVIVTVAEKLGKKMKAASPRHGRAESLVRKPASPPSEVAE
jgi:hypothetical protein